MNFGFIDKTSKKDKIFIINESSIHQDDLFKIKYPTDCLY
jgi:hypothetical protein